MLQVPRRIEYALRAVTALARSDGEGRLSFKDIAQREDIPRDYLVKIMRGLAAAGIVDARRGTHGGYALARPATEISFLDVIEASDRAIAVNLCTEHGSGCARAPECPLARVWQSAEDAMREVFARTTVAAVLSRPLSLTHLTTGPRCVALG